MNNFKFSLYSILLFLTFFVSTPLLALEKTVEEKRIVSSTENSNNSVMIADVNVDEAKITSQDNTTIKINFTVTNGKGIQAAVKYGIELIKDGTQYISDQKVYDESITLYENTTVKKSIVYEAPSNLSGSYTIVLSLENSASFPLGIKTVGKVKLIASSKAVTILRDTCYLSIDGEKGNPQYPLDKGVDIDAKEMLNLTCTAVNDAGKALTTTPKIETRYINAYGEIVPPQGGSVDPISFLKGEKKVFTIPLPKVVKPQFYAVKVILSSEAILSNAISFNYIVHGAKGVIHTVTLDKDNYLKGEKGSLSVLWSATAGIFTRNSASTEGSPDVTLTANIRGDGGVCTSTIKEKFTQNNNAAPTTIPFTTNIDCINPLISVTLTDANGTVLDQKGFNYKSNLANLSTTITPEKKPSTQPSILAIAAGGVIVVLLLCLLVKKRNTPPPSTPTITS